MQKPTHYITSSSDPCPLKAGACAHFLGMGMYQSLANAQRAAGPCCQILGSQHLPEVPQVAGKTEAEMEGDHGRCHCDRTAEAPVMAVSLLPDVMHQGPEEVAEFAQVSAASVQAATAAKSLKVPVDVVGTQWMTAAVSGQHRHWRENAARAAAVAMMACHVGQACHSSAIRAPMAFAAASWRRGQMSAPDYFAPAAAFVPMLAMLLLKLLKPHPRRWPQHR
mmetsp:Transcript_1879/g.3795  ORF Transcript_1879/g.3795 Transcript_1879/m.3795 type:complete len:222 (-) Transcript_1879:218-883(-)